MILPRRTSKETYGAVLLVLAVKIEQQTNNHVENEDFHSCHETIN